MRVVAQAITCFVLLFFPAYSNSEIIGLTKYDDVITLLHNLEKKYPQYVYVHTYGLSTQNQPLYCLRLTDKSTTGKPKILVMAAIHGNEMLSTSVVLSVLTTILENHSKDYVRELLRSRDLYIVPITCPESYLRNREVLGIDPNRNFDQPISVNPIECLKRLNLQLKFDAVLSCHTFGRIVMYPYGNKFQAAPNYVELKSLSETMAGIAGYTAKQLCYCYPTVIYGTEADWFYARGARISLVIELGLPRSHARQFDKLTVDEEVRKTYWGFIYFFKNSIIKAK